MNVEIFCERRSQGERGVRRGQGAFAGASGVRRGARAWGNVFGAFARAWGVVFGAFAGASSVRRGQEPRV